MKMKKARTVSKWGKGLSVVTILSTSVLAGQALAHGVVERTFKAREIDWEVAPGFSFKAWTYCDETGSCSIPGPTIYAEEGDHIKVTLENEASVPHSLHFHGLRYTFVNDGAVIPTFGGIQVPDSKASVPPGGKVTYEFQAVPGTWFYHDHAVHAKESILKGMHGAVVIYAKGEKRPDKEFVLFLSDFEPETTGFGRAFSAINGKGHIPHTPVLEAKVGERISFRVVNMGLEMHTFHLHGHRWLSSGRVLTKRVKPRPWERVVDNITLGPADAVRIQFVEDTPGEWQYHCHFLEHMEEGMMGLYKVSP